jgi:hypothetical protein
MVHEHDLVRDRTAEDLHHRRWSRDHQQQIGHEPPARNPVRVQRTWRQVIISDEQAESSAVGRVAQCTINAPEVVRRDDG